MLVLIVTFFCMFTVEADLEKEGKKEKRRAGEDGGV